MELPPNHRIQKDDQKLGIQQVNRYTIWIVSFLLIANIIIDLIDGRFGIHYSNSRLTLVILFQWISFKLARHYDYRISAFITLLSLTVAGLLYSALPVGVLPGDIIVLFFLLILISIVPYLVYDFHHDRPFIFGWISVMIICAASGFVGAAQKLSQTQHQDFIHVFAKQPMVPFAFLATFIFLHILVYRFRGLNLMLFQDIEISFEKLNSEIKIIEKQQEEIKQQNHALLEFQNEIRQLNEELELRVLESTQDLEETNRDLLKYAFMNSHLLRGPIARLKGLLNIRHEIDSEMLLQYLKHTVDELGKTTTVIGEVVDRQRNRSIEDVEKRVEQLYGDLMQANNERD
jgi:hypothetical protein